MWTSYYLQSPLYISNTIMDIAIVQHYYGYCHCSTLLWILLLFNTIMGLLNARSSWHLKGELSYFQQTSFLSIKKFLKSLTVIAILVSPSIPGCVGQSISEEFAPKVGNLLACYIGSFILGQTLIPSYSTINILFVHIWSTLEFLVGPVYIQTHLYAGICPKLRLQGYP